MHQKYIDVISKHPEFYGYYRYCNICGFRFSKFKIFNGREAQCPVCGSLERDRHLYVYISALYPFLKGKKILHFSPMNPLKNLFLKSEADYIEFDFDHKQSTSQSKIADTKFEDNTFDYILCIHVLQNVVDDIKVMHELYRILKPNGTAFLCVPLYEELKEYYNVIAHEETKKGVGRYDHIRDYNLSTFIERLQKVGFTAGNICYPEKHINVLVEDSKLGERFIITRKVTKLKTQQHVAPRQESH